MTIQEKYLTHRHWTLFREWDENHRLQGYVAINAQTLATSRPVNQVESWDVIEAWWDQVKRRPSLPAAPTYADAPTVRPHPAFNNSAALESHLTEDEHNVP
jgi:hypothetical protein